MSLINCPECGNKCAFDASKCPSCGHPFASEVKKDIRIIRTVESKELPKWIYILIGVIFAVLTFFIFMVMRKNDDTANTNVNSRITTTPVQTTRITESNPPPREIIVASNPPVKEIVVRESAPAPTQVTVTKVESTPVAPTKGVVKVSAKIISKNGTAQPVARQKFYLLDTDLNSILSSAGITDDAGLGLTDAFALSVVNPNKYRETNQKAMAAIKRHIVYENSTDNQGITVIKDVKPDNYHLFAISTTPNSFAIWDSAVTIQVGQNELLLDPKSFTKVNENE